MFLNQHGCKDEFPECLLTINTDVTWQTRWDYHAHDVTSAFPDHLYLWSDVRRQVAAD